MVLYYHVLLNGNGDSAVSGSYTLLANRTYYIAIGGGRGGNDSYGGGNGGIQHLRISVGSSNVTLTYKVGGMGCYSSDNSHTGAGWPDGQGGPGSGGGGGSTSIYINNTLVASAGGGGGGGKTTAGTGGTATGGTGNNSSTVIHGGRNGQKWFGDATGIRHHPHYECKPDGGGGGGRFPNRL